MLFIEASELIGINPVENEVKVTLTQPVALESSQLIIIDPSANRVKTAHTTETFATLCPP